MSDAAAFDFLVSEADKYGKAINIDKSLFLDLFQEKSDWAFIIQMDALHETASRETFGRVLTFDAPTIDEEAKKKFVRKLNFQGQASIISLLKLVNCPPDLVFFVEGVRNVRNAYAHNISNVKRPMLDVICARDDGKRLLQNFSYIVDSGYNEMTFIDMVIAEPSHLRFGMLHQCMLFLLLLHANLGEKNLR